MAFVQNFKCKNILWFLFYVFLFFLILKNSFSYLDADLGWHLKVGQEIWQEKSIPHINHYNFSLENVRWVDHEWLSNILVYITYAKFGYIFLSFIFAVTTLAVIALLHFFINKKKNRIHDAVIATLILFSLQGMFPHLGLRLQEISLLFFTVLLTLIYLYTRNQKKYLLLVFPLLFFFWSCLHGGFLIGLVIMLGWQMAKWLEFFLGKYNLYFINFHHKLKPKDLFAFFISFIVSIISTLITPYGLELYSFLYDYKNTYYLTHIQEWLPQSSYPFQYAQLSYLGLISALLLINAIYAFSKTKKEKINLWQAGLILLFIVLSFKSRRHFPLLVVSSLPYITNSLGNLFIPSPPMKPSSSKSVKRLLCAYIAATLIIGSAQCLIKTKISNNPFENYCHQLPCQATTFLKNDPTYRDLQLYNLYDWGGYLIWEWPQKKLFIDGRLPQFAFEDHTFLEEYYAFYKKNKQEEMLAKHGIELVLLKDKHKKINVKWFEKIFFNINEKEVNTAANPLKDYLNNSDSWQIIYADGVAIIYKKNN